MGREWVERLCVRDVTWTSSDDPELVGSCNPWPGWASVPKATGAPRGEGRGGGE